MGAPRLLLAVLITSLMTATRASARQPKPVREGYVTTSDSARLFYRVMGRGGDTLIAIHGGPGVDLESIAGDFARLAERHVVIFYDQRGAGRSELPKDTSRLAVARQIADLEEVRRHFGAPRVTLVAHSYGPLLAASYALAHPKRSGRWSSSDRCRRDAATSGSASARACRSGSTPPRAHAPPTPTSASRTLTRTLGKPAATTGPSAFGHDSLSRIGRSRS